MRQVRPDELALLPPLEQAADTMFDPLGIGPLPGPGTVEAFAAALVVLVAGDPPVGLCRIEALAGTGHTAAPTSSSSRSIPTTAAAASAAPCCAPRSSGSGRRATTS